jgi:deazaflavin-dependent oxidoreductase (nitroreductase family)
MSPTTLSMSSAAPVAEPLPLAIRVLRRLNPLIVAVLRSPLHGLASRNLLLLHYVGAKSGTPRTLPLSYVELGDRVYLCTRSSRWWRSLRGGRPVELHLRGRRVAATPTVVDPHAAEALDALRAFLTANPKTGEMLYRVRTGPERRPLEDDLRREVLASVVVRLDRTVS